MITWSEMYPGTQATTINKNWGVGEPYSNYIYKVRKELKKIIIQVNHYVLEELDCDKLIIIYHSGNIDVPTSG